LGGNVAYLEQARQREVRVLIVLTGGHSNYTDSNGCFSVTMWRAALDRNNLAAIQPYVDDGTITGLYAIDEPHDWGNPACGPTLAQIDEICSYAEDRIPGIRCGVNAPFSWLAGYPYQHLGFLFTQSNFRRTSDWSAWSEEQLDAADWFAGPIWLSMNVSQYATSLAQVEAAGTALCRSEADGVMMWKYGAGFPFNQPGAHEAMQRMADECAGGILAP
jgi:hypothetical protein